MKKKNILLIFTIIIVITALMITIFLFQESNTEKIKDEWETTFGGENNDEGYFVFPTEDEGCLVTGITESYGNGRKDMINIKFDKFGNEEWNITFGGKGDEEGKALIQTDDKGFIIVGKTDSFGEGKNDVLILKINEEGEKQWNKTFGGEKNDRANSIVKTEDGGYIIVGRSNSFGNEDYDVLIIKINYLGEEEWIKTIGGENDDEGRSIIKKNGQEYIIAATTRSYGKGRNDIWIININNTGHEQWNKTVGYENSDLPNQIIMTENKNFITVGHSELNNSNKWAGIIVEIDENGNMVLVKTIENNTIDLGLSSIAKTDDGYLITGYKGPYGNEQDQLLVKIDLYGNEIWRKAIGGKYCDGGVWIQKSTDGYYFITGYKDKDGSGIHDIWLLRNRID